MSKSKTVKEQGILPGRLCKVRKIVLNQLGTIDFYLYSEDKFGKVNKLCLESPRLQVRPEDIMLSIKHFISYKVRYEIVLVGDILCECPDYCLEKV